MATYTVKQRQNIFDISLQLYGTIEGVYDLLVSNDNINMDTDFNGGEKLEYHSDFVVSSALVEYMSKNNIVPINYFRHVYFKGISEEPRIAFIVSKDIELSQFIISGDGTVYIDWGDNTDIEVFKLSVSDLEISHYYNNVVKKSRVVRIYGSFNIKHLDISGFNGTIYTLSPITVDEFSSHSNNRLLNGLLLFKGTYSVDLTKMTLTSLLPIAGMSLQTLDLRNSVMYVTVLDEYLIYIAKNYGTRRNCTVYLTEVPSGEYKEPSKDSGGNYIITTGMEAIYVITHDATWNESGAWVFNINNKIYQYEP